MQALILAAGRGSRLGGKTTNVPKCLLEVGRRPLIEHQLETLAEAGVGPVGMVLGYCADEIREIVGIRADYIFNARWKVTNSLYSFTLARDWVKGPLVILNCDILFHPAILDRLLAAGGDGIAFDSGSGDGREHMKVHVEDGRLVSMSKEMPADDVDGENVGIMCFTADTVQALFHAADDVIANRGQKHWLGAAVCDIAGSRDLRAVDIAGLPWGEIDFPYDLDRVRKDVWPAIRRSTRRGQSPLWRRRQVVAAAAALPVLFGALALRSRMTPEVMAWETVESAQSRRAEIRSGDRTQVWQVIDAGEDAVLQVVGPSPLRIDSRVVLATDADESVPYVLEVEMDGRRVGWFNESAPPSQTWRYDQWTIAKRRRTTIDVPDGVHTVRVRLVATDSGRCLLRVRQEMPEDRAD